MAMVKLVAIWLTGAVLALPAVAGESGHWKGKGVVAVTDGKIVKLADQSDHEVGLQEFDGVVFSIGERPFLDNARYQLVNIYDTGGLVGGGYKTFTAPDGVVHIQYKVTGDSWPKFTGEWKVTGGTERYKGITGNGTWETTWVSDTALWDVLEGDYTIP